MLSKRSIIFLSSSSVLLSNENHPGTIGTSIAVGETSVKEPPVECPGGSKAKPLDYKVNTQPVN